RDHRNGAHPKRARRAGTRRDARIPVQSRARLLRATYWRRGMSDDPRRFIRVERLRPDLAVGHEGEPTMRQYAPWLNLDPDDLDRPVTVPVRVLARGLYKARCEYERVAERIGFDPDDLEAGECWAEFEALADYLADALPIREAVTLHGRDS